MKGFTLVEMLVALLIFGLLAAAGVTVMRSSIDSQAAVRERVDQIGAFQRLRATLKSDLGQAAVRRTRSGEGFAARMPFMGGDLTGAAPLLALSRRGWENPEREPRASMQYVEYWIRDGRLERRVRAGLDGGDFRPPQVLAEGVQEVEIAFYAREQWRPVWDGAGSLPEAVRLDLTLDGLDRVSQLFLTPGAAR